MTPFLALIRKDLQVFFKDRRAVLMSFAAPILIGSFFGYVMGGMSSRKDAAKITLLVVDQENSNISRQILADLKADATLDARASALEPARQAVRTGKAPAAVVIPPGFGKEAAGSLFGHGTRPRLRMLYDPSHAAEGSMIEGILTGAVMQAVTREAFTGATGRDTLDQTLRQVRESPGMPAAEKEALSKLLTDATQYNSTLASSGRSGSGLRVPFETEKEALTAANGTPYNAYAHAFAGMSIQFMLFMGIDVGIGLLALRERGLWRRFRAAPLSKMTLLGSRTASATLIGMMILGVVFTFARMVFGVRIEGSFAGFVGVCAAFAVMTACYGLLIAALGKSAEAARGLSVLATLVMVMLSGAWVPSFVFPAWLQSATNVIPARWAMDGLDGMTWRGLAFSDAVLPIAALLVSAAIFGGIALARFRWEAE